MNPDLDFQTRREVQLEGPVVVDIRGGARTGGRNNLTTSIRVQGVHHDERVPKGLAERIPERSTNWHRLGHDYFQVSAKATKGTQHDGPAVLRTINQHHVLQRGYGGEKRLPTPDRPPPIVRVAAACTPPFPSYRTSIVGASEKA